MDPSKYELVFALFNHEFEYKTRRMDLNRRLSFGQFGDPTVFLRLL